ncbi:hypothetical protein AYI68_g7560, partial [Smittium mucronatum]
MSCGYSEDAFDASKITIAGFTGTAKESYNGEDLLEVENWFLLNGKNKFRKIAV